MLILNAYKKYVKTIFAAVFLLTGFLNPLPALAATTVTTDTATVGEDSILFNGSINSNQSIEGRGFEYTLAGETKTVANKQYQTELSIEGGIDPANGSFNRPGGIARDSSGNIYVADENNHVQKFSATGQYITQWGSYGSGAGQFSNPAGITVDSSNNIYVADRYNHRIQKFNSSGAFVASLGEYGSEDGQFTYPTFITVDSLGNLYVGDTGNNRIQKFNSSMQHILSFGSVGTGSGAAVPGTFNSIAGLAIDSESNLYVVNSGNHRVDKFTNQGTFIKTIGGWGSCTGCFRYPRGITVDDNDNLFVADTRNSSYATIKRFDKDGVFKTAISQPGSTDGSISTAQDVVVSSDGENVYVADTYNHRVQQLTKEGGFVTKWGSYDISGEFSDVTNVAYDSQGNIFVLESSNNRIQKFDNNGTFIKRWGSYGSADGQFSYANGIVVDSSGNVFVMDTSNNRIQKFDNNGTFIKRWGSYGSADGQFSYARGITVDNTGNIYAADTGNNRIQKFDNNGTFIQKWGTSGSGDGEFNNLFGVVVDSSGNVYALDYGNYRVQKFGSDGNFISQWGSYGDADNEFYSLDDIAIDTNDNVYVADSSNSTIKKFTANGDYVSKISQQEYDDIQNPRTIALNSQNKLLWSNGSTVKKIENISFVNGGFTVSATDIDSRILCETQLTYRAFTIVDGGRVYGQQKTVDLPACSGPNLKLDITLNDPGLIEGEDANYTFTSKNVGNSSYEEGGYSLYIVAPDGIDLATLNDEDMYECADYTDYIGSEIPSFSYHLGKFYYCDVLVDEGSIPIGSSTSLTLPFSVSDTPVEDVKMRAMVNSYGWEADSNAINQAMGSPEDIFTKPINNLAVYSGTKPGTTIPVKPEPGNPQDNTPLKKLNDIVVPNAKDNKSVNIQTPQSTKITCSAALDESKQIKKDDQYEYPDGLIEFCFDTSLQDNRVSLTFVTNLLPDQVRARKYDTSRELYFDIPDAEIVQTSYDGQPALAVSYTIEDNGLLDLDKTLGSVKDPVGLAVTEGSLANTGQSLKTTLYWIGLSFVVGLVGMLAQRKLRWARHTMIYSARSTRR